MTELKIGLLILIIILYWNSAQLPITAKLLTQQRQLNNNLLQYTIKENQSAGLFVGNIYEDIKRMSNPVWFLGTLSDLKFKLSQPNSLFELNEDKGYISTKTVIDLESICPELCLAQRGYVNLSINIWSGDKLQGVTRVSIAVEDINDNAPYFESEVIDITVREVLYKAGKYIKLPKAIDNDVSTVYNRIGYNLSADSSGHFKLVVNSDDQPNLLLTETLDSETKDRYEMVMYCWNKEVVTASSSAEMCQLKINIVVIDINDNEPRFVQSEYLVPVPENTPVGSIVYQLMATDKDPSSRLTYSFSSEVEPEVQAMFQIELDGRAKLMRSLDYERRREYKFSVKVTDGEFSGFCKVKMIVIDINDEAPSYTLNPSQVIVQENTQPGIIIARLTVKDHDSDDINGIIKCHPIPATYISTHRSTRLAQYATGHSSVNRNKNNVKINNSSSNSSSRMSKLSLEQKYQEIVRFRQQPLMLHDLQYSIILNRALDREIPDGDVQSAKLVCYDQGVTNQMTSTFTLSVTVLDQNDNFPTFNQYSSNIEVKENCPLDIPIFQFQATDLDKGANSNITYIITDQSQKNAFRIDSTHGYLYINTKIDRETLDKYQIIVLAHDMAINEPRHSTSLTVNITVLDENDNVPQLSPGFSKIFNISENKPIGTKVGQLKAIDPDLGLAGETEFSFLSSHQYIDFQLLSNGTLLTNRKFDRETLALYYIDVRMKDKGIPMSNSATFTLTIHILDENDNIPRLILPKFRKDDLIGYDSINVSLYNEPGTTIEEITVQDADLGKNSNVTIEMHKNFSLSSSIPSSSSSSSSSSFSFSSAQIQLPLFELNSLTREIKNTRIFTPNYVGCYLYWLLAEDHGIPVLKSQKLVQICLVDSEELKIINENGVHINNSSALSRVNVLILIILVGISVFLIALMVSAVLCLIQPCSQLRARARRGNRFMTANNTATPAHCFMSDTMSNRQLTLLSHNMDMDNKDINNNNNNNSNNNSNKTLISPVDSSNIHVNQKPFGITDSITETLLKGKLDDPFAEKILETNLDLSYYLDNKCQIDHHWTYSIIPGIEPTPRYTSLPKTLINAASAIVVTEEQRSDSGRGASDEDTVIHHPLSPHGANKVSIGSCGGVEKNVLFGSLTKPNNMIHTADQSRKQGDIKNVSGSVYSNCGCPRYTSSTLLSIPNIPVISPCSSTPYYTIQLHQSPSSPTETIPGEYPQPSSIIFSQPTATTTIFSNYSTPTSFIFPTDIVSPSTGTDFVVQNDNNSHKQNYKLNLQESFNHNSPYSLSSPLSTALVIASSVTTAATSSSSTSSSITIPIQQISFPLSVSSSSSSPSTFEQQIMCNPNNSTVTANPSYSSTQPTYSNFLSNGNSPQLPTAVTPITTITTTTTTTTTSISPSSSTNTPSISDLSSHIDRLFFTTGTTTD